MNQSLQNELDEVMEGLDAFIHQHDATRRTVLKAVDARDHEDDQDVEQDSLEGLAVYAKSSEMRDLKRTDPAKFREKYLNFVITHGLIAKGLVTPTQLGVWSYKLGQLPGFQSARSQPDALSKAVRHAETTPRPWEFELTPRGLQGLSNSPEMKALVRERPSLYRQVYLDFFASMEPAPTPQEISIKRQELEMFVPDDPTQSIVAKSVNPMTHAQSTIVQNFGPAFAPSAWLR